MKITRLFAALLISTAAATSLARETQQTTSSVYQVVDGQIVFPHWDSRTTEPQPVFELTVNDFEKEAKVFRERILLAHDPIRSNPFDIPEDATTFTITARSRQAGDVFPRLRVSLITPDNNRHRLFEGYWQTRSLETYKWPLSEYVRGKQVRLLVELLNPGVVEEERTWYFLRANIY